MANQYNNQTSSTFAGNSVLSPFYQYIGSAGFIPCLVIVLGIRSLIALFSILLNLDLVWLTWRNKKLHGTCNVLIALESLSLVFYQVGIIPIFGVALSGQNLIQLNVCFWIQLLPAFGRYFSLGMMAAIGLDRLKCVLLPIGPLEDSKIYIVGLILLSSFCPAYLLYRAFTVVQSNPDITVMCATTEIFQREATENINSIGLILNLLSPAIYCALGIFLYLRRKMLPNSDSTIRIYKSLIAILLIQLLGWGTNSAFLLFFSTFFASQFLTDLQKWTINAVFSYVICLATAANAPVLYFCSLEYRDAFKKHFCWINNGLKNDIILGQPKPPQIIRILPQSNRFRVQPTASYP